MIDYKAVAREVSKHHNAHGVSAFALHSGKNLMDADEELFLVCSEEAKVFDGIFLNPIDLRTFLYDQRKNVKLDTSTIFTATENGQSLVSIGCWTRRLKAAESMAQRLPGGGTYVRIGGSEDDDGEA